MYLLLPFIFAVEDELYEYVKKLDVPALSYSRTLLSSSCDYFFSKILIILLFAGYWFYS
jgi:hypothetical protein